MAELSNTSKQVFKDAVKVFVETLKDEIKISDPDCLYFKFHYEKHDDFSYKFDVSKLDELIFGESEIELEGVGNE